MNVKKFQIMFMISCACVSPLHAMELEKKEDIVTFGPFSKIMERRKLIDWVHLHEVSKETLQAFDAIPQAVSVQLTLRMKAINKDSFEVHGRLCSENRKDIVFSYKLPVNRILPMIINVGIGIPKGEKTESYKSELDFMLQQQRTIDQLHKEIELLKKKINQIQETNIGFYHRTQELRAFIKEHNLENDFKEFQKSISKSGPTNVQESTQTNKIENDESIERKPGKKKNGTKK